MSQTPSFAEFFETGLKPTLDGYERRRRKILRHFAAWASVIGLLGLAAVVFMGGDPAGSMIAVFIALAGIGLAWGLLTGPYRRTYKTDVVGSIVRFCNPELAYHPERGISRGQFESSRLFLQSIDRFRTEDHIAGTVGQTRIELSEAHAEYRVETRDSRGHRQTRWQTIFKGLFFIADFNKHFHGSTFVLPDRAEKLFGFLGRKLQSLNFMRGQIVHLEDPEFEKEFVVYADDQVEARYILSTSLMRRILSLKALTKSRLFLSFSDSRLNIAMETGRNLFEPRMLRKANDPAVAREYHDDVEMILRIVEELNLNTRIWTKT